MRRGEKSRAGWQGRNWMDNSVHGHDGMNGLNCITTNTATSYHIQIIGHFNWIEESEYIRQTMGHVHGHFGNVGRSFLLIIKMIRWTSLCISDWFWWYSHIIQQDIILLWRSMPMSMVWHSLALLSKVAKTRCYGTFSSCPDGPITNKTFSVGLFSPCLNTSLHVSPDLTKKTHFHKKNK